MQDGRACPGHRHFARFTSPGLFNGRRARILALGNFVGGQGLGHMSKIIFVLTLALGCIAASAAQAQSDAQKKAALSSPYLPKARACMDNLAAAGKAAGFDTDRDGGNVAIEHPTNQKKLGEILADTFGCLDTAFEMKKKKVVREKTG